MRCISHDITANGIHGGGIVVRQGGSGKLRGERCKERSFPCERLIAKHALHFSIRLDFVRRPVPMGLLC
jgi:hypothetical protein